MKRKISLSTTLTLIILTAALTISVTMMLAMRYFNRQVMSVSQRQAMYAHINTVDKTVREYYEKMDEQQLRQALAAGYVNGIGDAYTAYFSPEDLINEQLRMRGLANNVGVDLCVDTIGRVVVCRVHNDSAAAKAGVQQGDILKSLDGVSVDAKPLAQLQKTLDTAQKVMLSIQRGDTALAFDLSSYEYTVRSVTDTLLEGNIGYIRVTDFFENTPDQFRSTLSAVVEKGVSGVILDLRDNPGGSRAAAEEMISHLMPLGMYGTVTDSNGVNTKLSSSANSQLNVPSVVLINGGTAGEAEFMAGVLQEFSLTTVVGETSAGKAKYQQYFTLETDHSAIKLTVGEYGLLKGGSWQGKGIQPTLEVALSEDQQAKKLLLAPADDGQVQAAVSQLTTSTPPVVTVTTTTAAEATADATTTAAAQ